MEEQVEEWRKAVYSRFPDIASTLEVSNKGNIRNIATKKLYKIRTKSTESPNITIHGKSIIIHTIVIETFNCPRPNGMLIKHIDGSKINNNILNLKYVSFEEHNASMSHNKKGMTIEHRLEMIEEKLKIILSILHKDFNGDV